MSEEDISEVVQVASLDDVDHEKREGMDSILLFWITTETGEKIAIEIPALLWEDFSKAFSSAQKRFGAPRRQ